MNADRLNTARRRAMPIASLATLLLVGACAADPPANGDIQVTARLTPREHAEQVGRDVGAIVKGMRNAHGLY